MARAELELKRVRKQTGSLSKKSVGGWIIEAIEKTAGRKIE
jgi:hypothetical protein